MALVTLNWSPTPRQLQQFGVVAALFTLGCAVWLCAEHGFNPYVSSLAALGAGVGLCGVLWPETLRYPYLGLMLLTFPIGFVISYVVLGIIYFGMFTVVGLVFRALRRDALQRRFEPAAETYWQPKRMPTDMRRYLRQY